MYICNEKKNLKKFENYRIEARNKHIDIEIGRRIERLRQRERERERERDKERERERERERETKREREREGESE